MWKQLSSLGLNKLKQTNKREIKVSQDWKEPEKWKTILRPEEARCGGCTPVTLALGRQRQEDQEFKANLGYILCLRSAWAM
jgi:hypothetical protein